MPTDKLLPVSYGARMEFQPQKDVEMLAFLIWEKNGRVEGHALDHWLEAEYLIGTSSFVPSENRIEWVREELTSG